MEGIEDCSGSCRLRARILNRKITQVLMEVLIEREWIWWNEAAGKVATDSGTTASVHRKGEAVMEDGLGVWTVPSRVVGADLPALTSRSDAIICRLDLSRINNLTHSHLVLILFYRRRFSKAWI